MKLILSLTTICLLLSYPLADAAAPSHIVKLKASNVKKIAGTVNLKKNLLHNSPT